MRPLPCAVFPSPRNLVLLDPFLVVGGQNAGCGEFHRHLESSGQLNQVLFSNESKVNPVPVGDFKYALVAFPAFLLLPTLRRSLAGGRRSAYNWFAVGDESIQGKQDGRIERSEGYGDVVVTVFLGASVGIVAAYIYTVPLLFSVFWERAQLAES